MGAWSQRKFEQVEIELLRTENVQIIAELTACSADRKMWAAEAKTSCEWKALHAENAKLKAASKEIATQPYPCAEIAESAITATAEKG